MNRPFLDAQRALGDFVADPSNIERVETVAGAVAASFAAGGRVLACGNGGSACDAMHFCEELTGRFRDDRPALSALACIDPGHITCTANDFGFEHVFARWVEAHGRSGDVLVALSTSGNSENVIRAVVAADQREVGTVALLGGDGGKLKGRCTHEWIVPGTGSDRIQEVHMVILHAIVERVEQLLFG